MADETTVSSAPHSVQCPVCLKDFKDSAINGHLDVCLLAGVTKSSPITTDESGPPLKKARIAETFRSSPGVNEAMSSSSTAGTQSTAVFAMFHTNKSKVSSQNERHGKLVDKGNTELFVNKRIKRGLMEEPEEETASKSIKGSVNAPQDLPRSRRTMLPIDKPLAEMLRPNSLEEYFGQNKVVGQQTLLRSLLETNEIPSLILWGPPGCGKVCLR